MSSFLSLPDLSVTAFLRDPRVDPRIVESAHLCTWCPNCATALESSRCKLVCRQCGYYMSCADYY